MRTLVALALPLAVALGACGASDNPGIDVPALVARTITASEEATSYRASFKLVSDVGGKRIKTEGEGVSAADQSRGRYDAVYVEDGQRVKMDMIMVDGALYFSGKDFDAALPPGKSWLRMPDDTPRTMTPAEFVEFLREADDIEDVGREEIRGASTIHLRGPLDIEELVEDTSSEAARYFSRIPGAEELDATLAAWISEEDDRISRMALVMTHPDATGSLSMTADILEYDVSLDGVEAPDPATVAEG